ncbi:MAG: hypothetical protein AAFQ62_15860 [Pseudomonadota bacterium]
MNPSSEMMPVLDGFPRPAWELIIKEIEASPESTWQARWTQWARQWINATIGVLPPGYRLIESEHFFVMSAQEERFTRLLLQFLSRARYGILSTLEGIALDDGFGPHVLLMFDDQESYYRYIAHFYPEEGAFGLSSGIFLGGAYGHFAFPFVEMTEAEATAAHELTHACLRHLPIPTWLNEGLAMTMEDELCGSQPLRMDNERMHEHRSFWNASTIQEYWSGDAFNRPDEGMELSYELARYCVRALAHDYSAFSAFANEADMSDAGDSAAIQHFGGSVGGLIAQFFGDGDWSPKPDRWHAEDGSGV